MKAPRSTQNACGFVIQRFPFHAMGFDNKSAPRGIRMRRQIDGSSRLGFHVEHKVARQLGRKYQRRSLRGQN